ncbi:MAG: PEGA domain-containing protein [Deltaproteobacteria bacterium]|nr:PEGA domain-containing protein [Deltaproteobacteria bacterium]
MSVVAGVLVVAMTAGGLPGGTVRHVSRMTGALLEVVTASPGALVRVDGEVRGRTPVRVAGLAPGVHRVELKGGGVDSARSVDMDDGMLVRVEADATGVRVRSGPLADTSPAAAGSASDAPAAWRPDVSSLRSLLAQPWVYAAAACTGLALLGAGLLWTSTPDRFPVLRRLPLHVEPWQYTAARWVSVGAVATGLVLTAALWVVPALPSLAALLHRDRAAAAAPPPDATAG